jgi:hypothetical protein
VLRFFQEDLGLTLPPEILQVPVLAVEMRELNERGGTHHGEGGEITLGKQSCLGASA